MADIQVNASFVSGVGTQLSANLITPTLNNAVFFINSGQEILYFQHNNPSGAQVQAQILTAQQVDGSLTIAPRLVAVQPGTITIVKPLNPKIYGSTVRLFLYGADVATGNVKVGLISTIQGVGQTTVLTALPSGSGSGGSSSAPVASFTFSPTTGAAPLAIAFTNTSQNATSYSWNFGDGTALSTTASPSHTFSTAGTYSVALTATGPNGTNTSTQSITVTAAAAPTPTVAVTSPLHLAGLINTPLTLTATASVSSGTISNVQFQVGGVNQGAPLTASPYTTSYTPTAKGNAVITAIATASGGGTATSAPDTVAIYDSKAIGGGASVAGCSLGAPTGDYILFNNNQAAGGTTAAMTITIPGATPTFNYLSAYAGAAYVYYSAANNAYYQGTIAANSTPTAI